MSAVCLAPYWRIIWILTGQMKCMHSLASLTKDNDAHKDFTIIIKYSVTFTTFPVFPFFFSNERMHSLSLFCRQFNFRITLFQLGIKWTITNVWIFHISFPYCTNLFHFLKATIKIIKVNARFNIKQLCKMDIMLSVLLRRKAGKVLRSQNFEQERKSKKFLCDI